MNARVMNGVFRAEVSMVLRSVYCFHLHAIDCGIPSSFAAALPGIQYSIRALYLAFFAHSIQIGDRKIST